MTTKTVEACLKNNVGRSSQYVDPEDQEDRKVEFSQGFHRLIQFRGVIINALLTFGHVPFFYYCLHIITISSIGEWLIIRPPTCTVSYDSHFSHFAGCISHAICGGFNLKCK